MSRAYEVIIVGGGAAGLACAEKLRQKGVDFLLVEGRGRVGGRVHSLVQGDDAIPSELGAEFVHGAPASSIALLKRFKIPFYDVIDDHFTLKNKKLTFMPDFWDKLGALMNKLGRGHTADRNVKKFVETLQKTQGAMKPLFTAFVEGFHAADTGIISEKGLAVAEQTDDEGFNDARLFRPLVAYDLLLNKLFESLDLNERFSPNTMLKSIHWRRGHVSISCACGPTQEIIELTAKKLVLTVPLGVLKSTAIQWSPLPKTLPRLLDSVQMGHVQKINFKFKTRFWEALTEKSLSFVHVGPEHYFPTWWSLLPLRTARLIAWQGGPKAQEMAAWPEHRRVDAALKTLTLMTAKPISLLNREVESWQTHNWSTDPFSQGAYSYVTEGGLSLSKKLARPIENTIYFAGEATVTGATRGTVNGALDSGYRTAAQILQRQK